MSKTYIDKNGHFSKDAVNVSGESLVKNFSILTRIQVCNGVSVEQALAVGNGYNFPCEYQYTNFKRVADNVCVYRVNYTAKNAARMWSADELLIDGVNHNQGCQNYFYNFTF